MLITSVWDSLGGHSPGRLWSEFLDFLSPTIAMFYMTVPSESAVADYLYQIVKLHPLQEKLRADLVPLDDDAAHPAHHYGSVLVSWCAKKSAHPNCSGRVITALEDL